MSIIFADFPSGQIGLYGSDKNFMLNGLWAAFEGPNTAEIVLSNDPDPNIGSAGRVLEVDNVSTAVQGARFALPGGATTKVGLAYRLYVSDLPSGDWASWQGSLVTFRTVSNTDIVNMCLLSNGALGVAATNQNGTPYGNTTGPVIVANAWNHVEIAVERSATLGTIEVRVNGITVIDLENLNLGSVDIGQLFIGVNRWNFNNINKGITYYKDLVIWDSNGSVGNNFQGSVAVRDLYTDADISLNWTPSTGSTGWNLIDETAPNDADYIEAGDPPPAAAVFSLTDLPTDVTSVRALLPIFRAVKTDGGDCNLQVGLTPNNTDWDDGADWPMTTAYTYRWDVSELSPDTGVAWSVTEVNDAYVRANRTL